MRIVIADDLRPPRDYLARILRSAGHEVVAACADGGAALDACRTLKPDVVVLDVSMAPVSGSIAAREILEQKLVPLVIMASSAGQAAIRDDLIKRGATFVSKPFRDKQFLAEFDRAVAACEVRKGAPP